MKVRLGKKMRHNRRIHLAERGVGFVEMVEGYGIGNGRRRGMSSGAQVAVLVGLNGSCGGEREQGLIGRAQADDNNFRSHKLFSGVCEVRDGSTGGGQVG